MGTVYLAKGYSSFPPDICNWLLYFNDIFTFCLLVSFFFLCPSIIASEINFDFTLMSRTYACLQLFWQTQVSTLICDSKQLKKLASISSSLSTIRNIIYFEDEDSPNDASQETSTWKVSSFAEVEKLGRNNPAPPNLPIKKDIAVIMYTSGSTGLPKVCYIFAFMDRHSK